MTPASADGGDELDLLLFLKFIAGGWGAVSMFFWIVVVGWIQAPPSEGPHSFAGLSPGTYAAFLFLSAVFLGVGALLSLWLFGMDGGLGSPRRRYARWLGIGSLLLVDAWGVFHASYIHSAEVPAPLSALIIVGAGLAGALLLRSGSFGWRPRTLLVGGAIAVAPWFPRFVTMESWGTSSLLMTLLLVPVGLSLLLVVDLLLVWPPAHDPGGDDEAETAFEVVDTEAR